MIDSDVKNTEERIEELSETVSDLQNRAVHLSNSIENSEIQNISANRYLVVNQNGNGFECLDGGGDAGGKLGQCSVKKTNSNFDTAWGNILEISKNGMTPQENSEASQGNETHIFADETEIENDKQLSKVELTNCQAKSDLDSENNLSVIFKDEVEKVEDEAQIATNLNYGFIKVGNGISVNDGIISAPIITKATEDNFGIIKTGDGLVNSNGTISRDEINPATFSNFGVIKLGENLSINQSGEMEINDMANAATIYNLGNVKVCANGIVDLEEQTLVYRLFVTEDLVVQFQTNFDAQDDFSFVLELVSDGTHLIAFNENLNPQMSTLPINRGTTKLKITKKMGVPYYNVEISRLDAPEPTLLTPAIDGCISSEFMITSEGGTWFPKDILRTNYNGYCDIQELNFKFETLVCVDYVNYLSRSSSAAMGEFILRGSNDGKNWTTLIYKNGEIIYGKIYTELKGCFRYFNLKIGYNSDDNKPGGVTLWGTQIDNNESEIIPITPYMSSNETIFAKMTANNIESGSAADITDYNCNSLLKMTKTGDDWIQYELSEAKVANILELNFRGTGEYYGFYGDRHPNWFKLEGSNDDETWTLLLERQYIGNELARNNNVVFYNFENNNAYKYYKFICVATNSSNAQWGICGFKLYRREVGKHNLYNLVPVLSSNSQDGYEVTASSNYGSHYPHRAFDNSSGVDNKWLSAEGDVNGAWLKIELPEAAAANVVQIQSPNEGYRERAPKKFKIQGSNDDTAWTDLVSETNLSWSQNQIRKWNIENETAFKFYRILIEESNGANFVDIGEFIIGRTIREYKRLLHKYDYLVPAMSSNSQDGYVASSNSIWGATADACKAFNRAIRGDYDNWQSGNRTNGNAECSNTWVQIKLPTAKVCNFVNLVPREDYQSCKSRTPRAFTIEGSNDGNSWTVLLSVEDGGGYSGAKGWDIDNTTAYLYYRINISKTYEANQFVSIGELELFYKYIIQEY